MKLNYFRHDQGRQARTNCTRKALAIEDKLIAEFISMMARVFFFVAEEINYRCFYLEHGLSFSSGTAVLPLVFSRSGCGFTLSPEQRQKNSYSDDDNYYGRQLRLLQSKEYYLVIPPGKHDYLADGIAKDVDKE